MSDPASSPPVAGIAPAAPGDAPSPGPTNRFWVLLAAIATIMITSIEGTIVATAMPTIAGELGGFDLFSWVFTAYLLTQAVTIPIYGRLADLYGRKRMLLVGIFLFLAGSALCGLAWSMVSLIAFRIVQGLGAGALVPLGQTVISDIYSPAERARMQGYLSTVWGLGSMMGPVIGGFLLAHAGWPMVFWVNVPIGLVAAGLLVLALHERLQYRRQPIDYGGSVLMILGIGLLMYALVEASRLSATSLAVLGAAAFLVLLLFVRHENSTPEPIMPLELWRSRVFAGANIANLALGALLMSSSAFLALYVQGVMNRTALVAGMVVTASSFAWPIGSGSGGRIMLRTSYRATAALGAIPLFAGSLVMISLDAGRGPVLAAIGAGLIGMGMGLEINTFVVAVQSTVAWGRRGTATSAVILMRIIGQSTGAAVFGGIINAGLAGLVGGGGDLVGRVLDPDLRRTLAPAEIARLSEAIAQSLHNVYLISLVLVAIVAAATLFLPAGLNPVSAARARR